MRIAVIGNSRDVLDREKAHSIDSCDLVIRLNSFRLRGVERFTGTRTDIVSICLAPWVVKNALSSAADTLKQVPIVWTPSWKGHAEDHEVENAMQTIGHPVENLVFSDQGDFADAMKSLYVEFFERASSKPWPKTQTADGHTLLPTTGFLTIHLVKLRFPTAEVCISGFGLDSTLDLSRFDESGVAMWPGHDIRTEREWLIEGAEEGNWSLL